MADNLNDLPNRLIDEVEMENTRYWLSRLLEMIPVKGTLDYRCFLGAPWRIDFAACELGEIPYHVILGGSAVLEDPEAGPRASWSPVTFCCFRMDRRMRSTMGAMRRRTRLATGPRSTSFFMRMRGREIAST